MHKMAALKIQQHTISFKARTIRFYFSVQIQYYTNTNSGLYTFVYIYECGGRCSYLIFICRLLLGHHTLPYMCVIYMRLFDRFRHKFHVFCCLFTCKMCLQLNMISKCNLKFVASEMSRKFLFKYQLNCCDHAFFLHRLIDWFLATLPSQFLFYQNYATSTDFQSNKFWFIDVKSFKTIDADIKLRMIKNSIRKLTQFKFYRKTQRTETSRKSSAQKCSIEKKAPNKHAYKILALLSKVQRKLYAYADRRWEFTVMDGAMGILRINCCCWCFFFHFAWCFFSVLLAFFVDWMWENRSQVNFKRKT